MLVSAGDGGEVKANQVEGQERRGGLQPEREREREREREGERERERRRKRRQWRCTCDISMCESGK